MEGNGLSVRMDVVNEKSSEIVSDKTETLLVLATEEAIVCSSERSFFACFTYL